MKSWILRNDPPIEIEKELETFSPLVRRLLYYRGIETADAAEKFITPIYERDIHDPMLMLGMERAVGRILRAMKENEHIVVFGDYDADGIPGAAIMHTFFKKIGYENFEVYIPDRYTEQYGLAIEIVELFAERGTKVMITVDCGITDVEEIERAQALGIDVILTDHHLPHDLLPPAYAIINNKQTNDKYPFKYLCGATTAWKLVQGILQKEKSDLPDGWEKWLLDLVAIATICDMVPLQGENRVVAQYGLQVLRKSPRVGIQVLAKKMKINQQYISEDDIAFSFGPRINIASRMTHGVDAFTLLTTDDYAVANILCDQLQSRNEERKETVQMIIDSINNEFALAEPPALIARGNESWRIGVLGLTATRIMEKYERPICLWARNHVGELKGSVRSDGTVNVVELFEVAGGNSFFIDYGGHYHSGGFSLAAEREAELESRLINAYAKIKNNDSEFTKLYIDRELVLDDVIWEKYKEIEKLAPFGMGNPKPVFLFRSVEIIKVREFGKNGNTHLELTFKKSDGKHVTAIAFFTNTYTFGEEPLKAGKFIDMAANFEKSMFRSFPELRLKIVDIRNPK